MKRTLKKAFTITELVIVIAVIAILAAVLIPTFSNVIESANKSAALQTCNNALKNYNAEATVQGIDSDSMVFESDGYCYVYWNSKLNYIGKMGDHEIISIHKDGSVEDNTKAGDTWYHKLANGETGSNKYTELTLKVSGSDADIKPITFAELEESSSLYLYSIDINKTTYVGYFAIETGSTPKYQTEGATYSYKSAIAVLKAEEDFTVVLTPAGA